VLQLLATFRRLSPAGRAQDGDRGATAVEYGLMVALIGIAIMAAVIAMANKVISTYGQVASVV
jgi:pilus assembly protein Flp/PilA